MPIYKYSVLKGDPKSGQVAGRGIPHYHIALDVQGTTWDIAVNIESSDGSEVLYFLNESYAPPDAAALQALPLGLTALAGVDANPAVDFVRSRANGAPIVTLAQMTLLPRPGNSASGNLQNAVIQFLDKAIADKDGTLYAFGSEYSSGLGIHDIHMNQGNPAGNHGQDNGVWQDGMLVFEMPATRTWAAIFIAFQNESWSTDGNGNPV